MEREDKRLAVYFGLANVLDAGLTWFNLRVLSQGPELGIMANFISANPEADLEKDYFRQSSSHSRDYWHYRGDGATERGECV